MMKGDEGDTLHDCRMHAARKNPNTVTEFLFLFIVGILSRAHFPSHRPPIKGISVEQIDRI